MDEEAYIQQTRLVEALNKAVKDLKTIPIPLYSTTNFVAIEKVLELETQLSSSFCNDPILYNLSRLLLRLKTQFNKLRVLQGYGPRSFYHRHIANYEVYKITASIEAQVRSWIDKDIIKQLVHLLLDSNDKEEKLNNAFAKFQQRLSSGFDTDLQELILKAKVFQILETMVCNPECSKKVREQSAHAIVALVEFNKDVFVGQVLMGNIIEALVSMVSYDSIKALTSLIRLVKIPLVYEIEENNYIPKISSLLSSKDLSDQLVALECVLELAYFARKEAIEAMLKEGLIDKLLELQRVEIIENERYESNYNGEKKETRFSINSEMKNKREDTTLMENCPFASCVIRFVGKLEMGEGLEKEEKRELKMQILRRIREATGSESEATSIVADVLWGSSPLLT